jgi:hypothetical protein
MFVDWQPFETAPKDRAILAYGEDIGVVVVKYDDRRERCPWVTFVEYYQPPLGEGPLDWPKYSQTAFSDWMELPDRPKRRRFPRERGVSALRGP